MDKKIPRVYVKQNKKINNNKEIFYSYKDEYIDIKENNDLDEETVRKKISDIFSSRDFIYKKKVYVRTDDFCDEVNIVYKTFDYLLTIDNKKIYISDIKDIRSV